MQIASLKAENHLLYSPNFSHPCSKQQKSLKEPEAITQPFASSGFILPMLLLLFHIWEINKKELRGAVTRQFYSQTKLLSYKGE